MLYFDVDLQLNSWLEKYETCKLYRWMKRNKYSHVPEDNRALHRQFYMPLLLLDIFKCVDMMEPV